MRNVWLPSVGSQPVRRDTPVPSCSRFNAAAVATTRTFSLSCQNTHTAPFLFIISAYRIVIYFHRRSFCGASFRIAPINPAVIEIISLAQLPPVLVRNRNILRGTRNDQSFGWRVPASPTRRWHAKNRSTCMGDFSVNQRPRSAYRSEHLVQPVVVYPFIQRVPDGPVGIGEEIEVHVGLNGSDRITSSA